MTDKKTRLVIETQTPGEGKAAALANELDALAAEAGEAAPKLSELADELREMEAQDGLMEDFARLKREAAETGAALDKAARQVDGLATALAESRNATGAAITAQQQVATALDAARARHAALKDAVTATSNELRHLKERAKETGDATGLYGQQIEAAKGKLDGLKAETKEAGAAVKALAADQKSALATQKEAEAAQRSLATEYDRAEKNAKRLSAELGTQRTALDGTRDALKNVGLDTAGLSAKQLELKARLLEAQRQVKQYSDTLGQMRAESQSLGPALEATFRQLGIRGVRQITAEIEQLQATMRSLRGQKLVPEDAARATAELQARIDGLRRELSGADGAARQASQGMAQLGREADTASSRIGAAAHKAAAWTATLVGFDQVRRVAEDIIETGSAFEQLERRLSNMLGSADAATQAMADIKEMARTTPFEVRDLTDAYATLTAFGLKPSMEQMRALTDTAATLGGGTEALEGVVRALGQAWTKSKLQGEEIQQLAERGVPIWDLLAEATGKNVEELQKLSAAGALGRDVITKLIDALGQRSLGASADLMQTYAGAVSNAKDALDEFFDLVARSGILDYLTERIQALLAEFERMRESGELEEKAKEISDAMIAVGQSIETVTGLLAALGPAFEAAFRLWTAKIVLDLVAALRQVPPAAAGAAASIEGAAGRITVATTGAGRAVQALTNLLRYAGWAAVASEVLEIAANLQRLREQLAKLEEAERNQAATADRLAARYREISEATGVAVTSMEELDEALRRGEIVRDKATGAYLSAEQALRRVSVAAEDTADKLDGIAAAKLVAEFDEIAKKSGETAKALQAMAESLDFGNVQGVAAFTRALSELEEAGKISATEVGKAWEQALTKLDSGQLNAFATNAQAAFEAGRISAERFAQINDQVLAASFARLGVNAATALGKISPAAQDAINAVDGIVVALDNAKVGAEQSAAAIELALTRAFAVADSLPALDAIVTQMNALGASGKLSAEAMTRLGDAAASARAKIEDLTPGVQSVEEAFRKLGVTSQRELDRAAREAEDAFEVIRESGEATAAELRAAFTAYAEAAVAANGGVVSEALKAEAAQQGLAVEADKAGKVIVQSMKEAAEATKAVGDSAKDAGDKMKGAGDAATKAADTTDEAGQRVTVAWLDAAEAASSYAREAGEIALRVSRAFQFSVDSINAAQAAAAAFVARMEELDRQQDALNEGAAKGVEDLRLRLLELEGTDEQIAAARKARDEAEIRREIELTKLELQRAELRGDKDRVTELQGEVRLLEEQLVLLDRIYKAEQRQREGKSTRNAGGGGGLDAGGASGGTASGGSSTTSTTTNHYTFQIGGILDVNDPVTLDKLGRRLRPVLGDLDRRGF